MHTELFHTTPGCEIRSSRIFHAPVEQVFSAWINPDYLAEWWGPAGFTNTFIEFDPRPGGRWTFIMHGPDKGNYPNECEFLVIEKPNFIAWKRYSKPIFDVVATFEPVSIQQTRILFRMVFSTEKECAKVKRFAQEKNEENFDRLEKVLASMLAEKN